ncbi:Fc.00g057480.m01.CDS01 [Cosmosporella sp. VM-42]
MRPKVFRNLDNRPDSTLSYGTTAPDTSSLTRRYLRSLQVPDGYGTPEDDMVTETSSYRKLRRSRSLFTSSDSRQSNSDYYFNNGTPVRGKTQPVDSRYAPLNKENEPLRQPPTVTPELRAPKSMSFLHNRHDRAALRTTSRAENDLAVHLAREKLREQVEQQVSLRSHPSMFFRSRNKRSESSMGFRKSLRNSSNNSTALSSTFVGDTLNVPKQGSFRNTARKVSKTLRTKLKGLFARPKSTETPGFTTEVQDPQHDSEGESCLRMEIPSPDEASMSRVLSHLPSLHSVPSNQQMRSRKGSVASTCSGDEQQFTDDKSRVTSWTNSVTNTISSQGTIGEWERQQLSVIKENSTHISPSSLSPANHPSDVFRGEAPRLTVDSQRVYSALMKRMEESKRNSIEQRVTDQAYQISPTRISSANHSGSGRWTPSTIRHVQDDDVFQNQNRIRASDEISSSGSIVKHPQRSSSIASTSSHDPCPIPAAEIGQDASSTRRHVRKCSELEQSVALSQRSSAFFGSPTCHLFRTTSPFRRALQENMKATKDNEQADLSESRYLSSLSALSLPTRRPSSSGSDRDPRTTYAESIYSSTTEDVKSGRGKEVEPIVASFPEPPVSKYQRGHGDVTIFVDRPTYKPSVSHKRDVSTASSVEWKTWLSANVSKLETPFTSPEVRAWEEGSFGLSHAGHVRELAEIESPGEVQRLAASKPDGSLDRGPLGLVEGSPFSVSSGNIMRKPSNKFAQVRDENDAPGLALCSVFQPDPPQILRENQLRTVPSLPIVRTESGPSTPHEFSKIPRMRSLNTIACVTSPREEALLKRRSRSRLNGPGSSVKSSPGLTGAIERQFGPGATGSPAQRVCRNMGQPSLNLRTRREEPEESLTGTGLMGPALDAQAMGSKRMVDIFLNNRRNRAHASKTNSGSSPAFL